MDNLLSSIHNLSHDVSDNICLTLHLLLHHDVTVLLIQLQDVRTN